MIALHIIPYLIFQEQGHELKQPFQRRKPNRTVATTTVAAASQNSTLSDIKYSNQSMQPPPQSNIVTSASAISNTNAMPIRTTSKFIEENFLGDLSESFKCLYRSVQSASEMQYNFSGWLLFVILL